MAPSRWPCLAALLLVACGAADDAVLLDHWTLSVPGEPSREVTLPAHFALPGRPLEYTLRTAVHLGPEQRGKTLTLALPYFTGLTRLRLGAREIGSLDPPAEGSYRTGPVQRFHLPAELTDRADLPLTLIVAHEWAQSAWFDTTPRLSATVAGDSWTRFVIGFDRATAVMALLLCALVLAISLAIYLRSPQRPKHRWLALGVAGTAWYPLFQLGLTQKWLGRQDSTPLFFVLPLACYCSVRFLYEHLARPAPTRWWLLILAIPAAVAIPLGGPFTSMPLGASVVMVVVAVSMVAQFFVPLPALLARRAPVGTFAIWSGWIIVSLCIAPDISAWIGLGKGVGGLQLIHVAIMLFLLTQLLALAREHAHSLAESEKLNAELRELSTELVRQLQEREADAARRRLFADLAHELGTPTSTVMGIAETLRSGIAPEHTAKLLDILEREGGRLERLVADVRLLAFLEQPDLHLELAPCDLVEVAEAACERARHEAGDGGPAITCVASGPAVALCDRLRIEQVLANLLDNALRYTPAEGRISVAVTSVADHVRLEIEDGGKGVPDEMLAQLGGRFVRMDPSRTRRTGGHGLGLSIVMTIVQRHGGTIKFQRASLGGLGVVIELPRAT